MNRQGVGRSQVKEDKLSEAMCCWVVGEPAIMQQGGVWTNEYATPTTESQERTQSKPAT